MKTVLLRRYGLLVVLFGICGCAGFTKKPVDYVRPQIDTVQSRWFYFSSACRPFGMVNLSPDTDVIGGWKSGYLYDSKYIRCFSHIHCWQLAGIPVMPGTGDVKAHLGLDDNKAAFSHDNEVVRPGYHKVVLSDRNIEVELTSTCRVGFHKYRFPASDRSHLAFNLDAELGDGKMQASSIHPVSKTEIEGSVTMAPTHRRKKPCTVYFVAQLNKPYTQIMAWEKDIVELSQVKGQNPGFYVAFPTDKNEIVMMKLAISYVSCRQARKNLQTELNHWDFDRVVRESQAEWNQWLSQIQVEGGSEKQRIKFYTDLWHALQGRRIVSDVDGQYIDNTGDTPKARQVRLDKNGRPLYPHYNFDALWGAQWSLNLLWSLAYPELMDGFANTMIDLYRNGGLIPRGPAGGNYTYVMIGDPAASFFACAYNKGIRNYDIEKVYEGLRKNAFPGGIRDRAGYEAGPNPAGGGMKYYVERGYIPLHKEGGGGHREGAAQTLEYAYQDWCLAQLAKALGKESDYELLLKRSENYKNLFNPKAGEGLNTQYGFNPQSGWICPKEKDGSWYQAFSPIGSGESNCKGFVESNSAIYTWFVPHDLNGLAGLMGGRDQDWCLAQLAKALGKESDYELLLKRSENYKNLFNPKAGEGLNIQYGFNPRSGWICPKEKDGSWYQAFSPIGSGEFNCKGFVESNSAIYTWFVPHDLNGLAGLMGGRDSACRKLNRQFELAAEKRFIAPPGGHSVNWVDYGNQPSTGMAHVFSYLSQPWLSQYWVRRVKEETFGDITPYGGYNGDEDQGQMGALGVLMAIGLFDIEGGAATQSHYEITSGLFDKITIHLNTQYYTGKKITLIFRNNSAENMYIQSARFNGRPWNDFQISHDELMKGGTLEIELGPEPDKTWGIKQ